MIDNNEDGYYRYVYEMTVKKVKIKPRNSSYHPEDKATYDPYGTEGHAEVIEPAVRIWAQSTGNKHDCDRLLVKFLKWNDKTSQYDDQY